MDVARVGGVQGAEDEQDLARAVGGGVEERGAGHFEGVLERRIAFWLLRPDLLQGGDVLGGVAGHVADADGDAVAHADYAHLGDGVLLEEFEDEFSGVADREEVAGWPEVFFGHGGGHVNDHDQVADDASL